MSLRSCKTHYWGSIDESVYSGRYDNIEWAKRHIDFNLDKTNQAKGRRRKQAKGLLFLSLSSWWRERD